MEKTQSSVTATDFYNVQVIAIPEQAPDGKIIYKTTFIPETLVVTTKDAVLNYQIIDPSPAGVQFKSLSIKPQNNEQFSDPSISKSGKLVTFSDANTKREKFNLTFHFTDKDGIEFNVDPVVDNDPEPPAQ